MSSITHRSSSARGLVEIAERLRERTRNLRFAPPVDCVYAPLDYAWAPHRLYLERYGAAPREVLFVGMNPGPFGMVQTGVPFGDAAMVRDWLGIEAPVERPAREHPKRPVRGFDVGRGEVSGRALLGLGARALRRPGAVLPARLRVELLSARLRGRDRAQPHPRPVPPRRARSAVRGVRRRAGRGDRALPRRPGRRHRPIRGSARRAHRRRRERAVRGRAPPPARRARPPTAAGPASSTPPCMISGSHRGAPAHPAPTGLRRSASDASSDHRGSSAGGRHQPAGALAALGANAGFTTG